MRQDSSKPVLGCARCARWYSLDDVRQGNYWLETMVCSYCYAEMQASPYQKSCFGKPMLIWPSGKREYGYNPKAWECSTVCPDREICRKILVGGFPDETPL